MSRVVAVSAIIALGIGLVALLYFKPWQTEIESPRFEDRLPMCDIIGKTNILSLSKDFIPAIYHHQISFREFLSPEFILSQGKINGLNLQQPVYFFGNHVEGEVSEWGVMLQVTDSSKILSGIKRFEKVTPIKDSVMFEHKIFICPEYNLSMAYGKDWVLISDRKSFKRHFDHVIHAQLKSIYPRWRRFIEEKLYTDKAIQFNIDSEELREYGISSARLAASSDSNSITLHTRLTHFDTIPFTLKASGERFERKEFTKRMINLHLNIDRLRNDKDHPLYLALKKIARKVSFPLDDFLATWQGDITFRQGGIQTVAEPYIESELDENFNVSEVVKYKQVKISGFALRFSVGNTRDAFMNRLFDKGIFTRQGDKVRMLYFPPMKMHTHKGYLDFYTSSVRPKAVADSTQSVLWDYNYTPVLFTLDSIQTKVSYGRINIGLNKLVNDKLNEM